MWMEMFRKFCWFSPLLTRIQVAGQSAFVAIPLSKIRSVPLLFTVIASFILAVCPLPMDTHWAAAPSEYTVVLAFIDGRTGFKKPASEVAHAIRTAFTKALDNANIFQGVKGTVVKEYSGLYEPEDPTEEDWVYFEMTGMPECKPKCFGWKAKGKNKDRRNYRQTYIGISKGLPAYQGFKGTWGQPETGLMRDEWTRLLGIFNKKFMIPRLPLLSLPAGQVPAHHVPSIHQHPTYSHHFPPGIYLSPYSPSLLPPPPPLSEPQFKPPPPDSHLWTNL